MWVFLLFLIPALVALVLFVVGRHRVTILEFVGLVFVQMLVVVFAVDLGNRETRANTEDHAVYSGRVREMRREKAECRHAYACNCRDTSCDTPPCSEECDTCYEHPFDFEWNVYSTSGDVLTLDSPDHQGLAQPVLWKRIREGEPMAVRRRYQNHVRAAPEVFFASPPEESFSLPSYPLDIRDGYQLDRLVTVGMDLADADEWNKEIAELAADLSSRANIVIVVLRDQPLVYMDSLRWEWRGGKENDVVLVASLDAQRRIQWADVMAWSTDERLKVALRGAVEALGVFERRPVLDALRGSIQKHYVKRPLSDFEYLRSRSGLSLPRMRLALAISLAITALLGFVFYRNGMRATRREARWGTLVTAVIFTSAVGVLGGWMISRFQQDCREQELDIAVKYHQARSRITQLSSELEEKLALRSDESATLDALVRKALASTSGEHEEALLALARERRPDRVGQLQPMIEAARRTYESDANQLEHRKRVYRERLSHFPERVLASILGFPRLDFDAHQLEAEMNTHP